MVRPIHAGAQSLDDAGLLAFPSCGHWWVYPVHATVEQWHDVARFNLGLACSFCHAAWLDATNIRASGTAWRVN